MQKVTGIGGFFFRAADWQLLADWYRDNLGIKFEDWGGSIINWSSIGGLNASDMPTSVYSAAKAGVIAFTKAAAVEYGARYVHPRTGRGDPVTVDKQTRPVEDFIDAVAFVHEHHPQAPQAHHPAATPERGATPRTDDRGARLAGDDVQDLERLHLRHHPVVADRSG